MSARNQNPLRRIGEQIQAIVSTRPQVSPAPERTARVLESYENVPALHRPFFESHHASGKAFPYTVVTPAYEVAGERITSKLICVIGHTLYVLEETDGSVVKTCYPIDEINHVEVTHRPTDLRIKIDGITNLGLPATSIFGCGNTGDYIFAPIFQRIRLRITSLNDHAPSRHLERLDPGNGGSYKVLDMARHCLMAGETVVQAVLQPEIRPGIFSIKTNGARCPTHTCILTDKELVTIREEPALSTKEKCGGICNFVPLSRIESITTSRKNSKLLSLSFQITNGEVFESLFDLAHEEEVEQFLNRTRSLLPEEKLYVRD